MGIGLESSSHKYGLFHETCIRYELIAANGDVIVCSKVLLFLTLCMESIVIFKTNLFDNFTDRKC